MANERVCSIGGCSKRHLANGLCSAHYAKAKKYGDALASAPSKPERLCSIDGCGRKHVAHGFCNSHYKSYAKHGDPLKSEQWGKQSVCSIEGCGKRHYAHGLCAMHNYRRREHGAATAGRTFNGLAEKFFKEVVLNCHSEECLFWPYTKNKHGYAVMARHGQKRSMLVHRLACEARHGPPPTPEHQAAHSCGKGSAACVNPSCTRWDDQKGNESDKLKHGTRIRGEEANSKLSEAQVREIRAAKGQITQVELAKLFSVRPETISNVWRRKTWAWLD